MTKQSPSKIRRQERRALQFDRMSGQNADGNADSTNPNPGGGQSGGNGQSAQNQSAQNQSAQNQSHQGQHHGESVSCGRFPFMGDPATLGARWEDWLERWELSVLANSMNDGPKTRATFLLQLGAEATAIWKTKRNTDNDSLDEIKKTMTEYFVPKRSEYSEVCKFRRAMRLEGETVGEYVMRLRSLAQYCKFRELDKEIERQLVIGCGILEFERDCCRVDDLTLDKAIRLAQGYERCEASVSGLHKPMDMERTRGSINHLNNNGSSSHNNRNNNSSNQRNGQNRGSWSKGHQQAPNSSQGASNATAQAQDTRHTNADRCGNCGKAPHVGGEKCPAKGVVCYRCQRVNHYGSMCRSKGSPQAGNKPSGSNSQRPSSIKQIDAHDPPSSESHTVNSEDYAEFMRYKSSQYYMSAIKEGEPIQYVSSGPKAAIGLLDSQLVCLVDTGSPVNVIDELTYKKLASKPNLEQCNTKYFGYTANTPLKVMGQFTTMVEFRGRKVRAGFIVIDGKAECLLSFGTARDLGIIRMADEKGPYTLNEVQQRTPTGSISGKFSAEELSRSFPNLFSGKLGCLKGFKVKLDVDPNVRPSRQPQRPVAFHLREPVERELRKQVEMGILEPVTQACGPTPWVSNLVVVMKDKDVKRTPDGRCVTNSGEIPEVRLTCDSRALNKAIRRTRYPSKTVEDLVHLVNGATRFSRLDLMKAFHQLMLEEESKSPTTITTHLGLFRYLRLHMGIACASEVFTEAIRQLLDGLPGQVNMTDDIMVFGKDDEDHHKNLMAVLQRLEESGLTLNVGKCLLYQQEITFFGLRFTKNGISPTEDRCRALKEAKPPTDAKSLHSFLCSTLFSARFMKDLATIAEPLWYRTKKDVPWIWGKVEQDAFDAIKRTMSTKCMGYFNKNWCTELVVDASPVGLGLVLRQHSPSNESQRHIVCFASRMLTAVERRYSQCEKEALSAVWGAERCWIYLLGHPFTLITDNRAVQLIFGSTTSKPPARIERWALRLTQFDFNIVHRPGATNMADYYSRNPCAASPSAILEAARTEEYLNSIVHNALPDAVTLKQVTEATRVDQELLALTDWLGASTQAFPKDLAPYKDVKDELSVTKEGVVLRGRQIIVPKALRTKVVDLAHRGHQGIVKTKALIRSRVWFPGIDAMVEQKVRLCLECQSNSDKPSFEPLKPSPMPPEPWHTVAGDFFGPLDDGTYWYVNLCEGSRWFRVDEVTACSESQVEPILERLFAELGAPVVYKTDNGSPFQSHGFKAFAARWGFEHRKITPEWPRANAAVESVMKKLGKVLKTAKVSGQDKRQALQDFLRAYRETPHSSTGMAPNVLMFGFSRSTGIPAMKHVATKEEMYEKARKKDELTKARMKADFDKRMKARESSIRIGNLVLIKLAKHRKNTPAWDPSPYLVTQVKGSMVTASRADHTTTRNSSFFKLFRADAGALESLTRSPGSEPCQQAPSDSPQADATQERVRKGGVEASPNTTPAIEPAMSAEQTHSSPEQANSSPKRTHLGTEQTHSNSDSHAPGAVKPQRAGNRGRPSNEQAAKNKIERNLQEIARKTANPPLRQSARLKGKSE